MVNHVSTFPTIEQAVEIVDIFLTWKIWEYCEGVSINDHD